MNGEISSSIYGTCFGFGYAIIYSVSSFQKSNNNSGNRTLNIRFGLNELI